MDNLFSDNFEVSFLAVEIGRKEFEDRLIDKLKPIYNAKEEQNYSITEVQKTHENAYKPWSEEEESQLLALEEEGKTKEEIAQILGRKKGAIYSRLKKIKERKEHIS